MIQIRPSEQRGSTQIDWLKSKHSFSFGDYYDPAHHNFSVLRVINEDWVAPGKGFGTHPHRDMEIITYVLEGALEHKDSLGTGSVIVPGDVQRMSAGTGILHSEFNPQTDKPVHLLQIWIMPRRAGIAPSYAQQNFAEKRKKGGWTLLVSPDGRDDSLTMNQNATMQVLDLEKDQQETYDLDQGRCAWLQVARGSMILNGNMLARGGDGAALRDIGELSFTAHEKTEMLLFDMAA